MTTTLEAAGLPRDRWAHFRERFDRFFMPDSLYQANPEELARTRMGLRLSFIAGLGTLAFLPLQLVSGLTSAAWLTAATSLVVLSFPFVLRKRAAMRSLGQILCGVLAAATLASVIGRDGWAGGVLPFLVVLPIIGLLVRGPRGAIGWGVVALAIASIGLGQTLFGFEGHTIFPEMPVTTRYAIAMLCIAGVASIAQSVEIFWNRTALESADRARAELLEEEERNRSLLEHATEGVMVVTGHAVVKFASPAAERLVGLGPGEAVGHRLRDFTHPEDFLRTRPSWIRVAANVNGVERFHLRTRPGLGRGNPSESRVLDITVSNRLDNPAIEGVIVRMRDVTDLARAEANYEALIEHSLQGLAVSCDGETVYANQALADLFGVDRERFLEIGRQRDPTRLVHPDDRDSLRDRFENSPREQPGSAEIRVRAAEGGWRWIQLKWASAHWEGRPARQIAYADITAEKELSAQHERLEVAIAERTRELEASQRSLQEQERMASIGTLAAGIAHQINNPIGAILTSADFALLVANEEGAEQVRAEALADIRAQAVRCGKIVRSVLQFSRSEPTEKWSADPTRVLRTAVDITARYAAESGATVTLDLCPNASRCSISMNPIEIEQVFVNLIRNAIESRPSGCVVEISSRQDDQEVVFAFEDNGPGVPQAHANHIFDPFYTTRLRQGGTGLGLSVAHGIVEDHGGRMALESRRRRGAHNTSAPCGARFVVRLPIEKTAIPA